MTELTGDKLKVAKAHEALLKGLVEALTILHGEKAASHFLWEMTPVPVGRPYLEQYKDGLDMLFAKGEST